MRVSIFLLLIPCISYSLACLSSLQKALPGDNQRTYALEHVRTGSEETLGGWSEEPRKRMTAGSQERCQRRSPKRWIRVW